jgi:hypothetical protein
MTVTEFRTSRMRTFGLMFTCFLLAWPVGIAVTWLLSGSAPDPWWGVLLQGVLVGAVVGAVLAFLTPGWKPTWIRTSAAGLEMSAVGSDPIHLEWTDIARVEVRRKLLSQVLEVTPADMDRVTRVREGNGMPRSRDGVFPVDLSRISPGPRALRAEIARWAPAPRQNADHGR